MGLFFGKIGRGWRLLWWVFFWSLRGLGFWVFSVREIFEKVQFLSGNFRTESFFLLLERQKCRSVIEFLSKFSKRQICDQWSNFANFCKIFEKWYKGKINSTIASAFRKISFYSGRKGYEFFEKIRTEIMVIMISITSRRVTRLFKIFRILGPT